MAKTLYVDGATGSDAVTYAANDAAHPWATITRAARGSATYSSPNAAEAAQAGDTVLIAPGIYNIATGYTTVDAETITNPALAPINDGDVGNYITFRGIGLVYVRMGSAAIVGPMIGCKNNGYIVWDNIQVDDYYGGGRIDSASVSLASSDHCQLLNCNILGHTGSYFWGQATYTDNYAAVWLQNCNNLLVRNNVISRMHDHATGIGGQSTTGITTYDVDDSVIEYNTIFDVGQGIIIKGIHGSGQQANNLVRYNFVYDNDWGGIRVWLSQGTIVSQNIIVNSSLGLFNTAVIAGGKNNLTPRFINNTLYNNASGIYLSGVDGTDAQYHNNLVIGGTYGVYGALTAPTAQAATFERNLYHGYGSSFAFYEGRSPSAFDFAAWQAYGAAFDPNGSNGVSPSFVNAGGSFALPTDFKLSGGSPALTLGRVTSYLAIPGFSTGDTIPAGAFITGAETIGASAGGSSPTLPDRILRMRY